MSSAPQVVLAPRARSSATPHSPSRCGRPCPRAAATHNTECCTGNVTLGLRLSSALLVFLDGVLGFFLLPARRPPAGWWWLQKNAYLPAGRRLLFILLLLMIVVQQQQQQQRRSFCNMKLNMELLAECTSPDGSELNLEGEHTHTHAFPAIGPTFQMIFRKLVCMHTCSNPALQTSALLPF